MTRARPLLLLTILTIAWGLVLWMLSPPHPEQARLGYSTSAFALQMVRDWPSLTIVLATPAREGYRLHTYVDFLLIPTYGALWIAMAMRYGQRAWLKWIVGTLIVGAVLCDLSENVAILKVLGLEKGFTNEMALAIRTWALRKWLCLWMAWFGISLSLFSHRLLPMAIAYAFVAGVAGAAWFTRDALLELVGPVLGLALLLQAIYFSRSSEKARA